MSRKLIIKVLIGLFVSEIVALLIWFLFDENYFILLPFASLVGLIFGYKGLDKKKSTDDN